MKVTIKVMPAAERDRTEDEASVQFNAAVYQGPTVKPSFQKLRDHGKGSNAADGIEEGQFIG